MDLLNGRISSENEVRFHRKGFRQVGGDESSKKFRYSLPDTVIRIRCTNEEWIERIQMLILSRKINERIVIGGNIEITITGIRGDRVRIGVIAPKEVDVVRYEIRKKKDLETSDSQTLEVRDQEPDAQQVGEKADFGQFERSA